MFDEFLVPRGTAVHRRRLPAPTSTAGPATTACGRSCASRGIDAARGRPDRPARRATRSCALGNRKNDVFNEVLARDGIAPYPGLAARARPARRGAGTAGRRRVVVEERPRGARRGRADAALRRRRRRHRRREPSTSPASRHPTCSCDAAERLGVDAGASRRRRGRRLGRRRRPAPATSASSSASTAAPAHDALPRHGADVVVDDLAELAATGRAAVRQRDGARPRSTAHRFPVDPWRLVEREYDADDLGLTETLFAVGNGYLGMRANPEEGRDAHSHGTFVNGFHETWTIQHAEDAFGFAKTGQTIVNVPDAKLMKLYVDDEPLLLATADLEALRAGRSTSATACCTRDLVWRTPAGKRVRVRSQRLGQPRATATWRADVRGHDARRRRRRSSSRRSCSTARTARTSTTSPAARSARAAIRARRAQFDHRVLEPRLHAATPTTAARCVLGYRCANSGMTLACALPPHRRRRRRTHDGRDDGRRRPRQDRRHESMPRRARRCASPSSSRTTRRRGVPRRGARRPLPPHARPGRATTGPSRSSPSSGRGSTSSGPRSDVEIRGDDAGPAGDALEPVPARPGVGPDPGAGHRRQGRHRRRLRGPLLLGHRDLRRPVPRLHEPRAARASCCGSAGAMLPAGPPAGGRAQPARRAVPVAHDQRRGGVGLLRGRHRAVPHQRRRSRYALKRYVDATGDIEFLADEGAEILVETARLWEDLGFYATERRRRSSTSTASPAPTSTRPSSTTTSTRT